MRSAHSLVLAADHGTASCGSSTPPSGTCRRGQFLLENSALICSFREAHSLSHVCSARTSLLLTLPSSWTQVGCSPPVQHHTLVAKNRGACVGTHSALQYHVLRHLLHLLRSPSLFAHAKHHPAAAGGRTAAMSAPQMSDASMERAERGRRRGGACFRGTPQKSGPLSTNKLLRSFSSAAVLAMETFKLKQ